MKSEHGVTQQSAAVTTLPLTTPGVRERRALTDTLTPVARAAELVALFYLVPTIYWLRLIDWPFFTLLLRGALVTFALLLVTRVFDWACLWRIRAALREFPRIIATFALGAIAMMAMVLAFLPDAYFAFPRQRPDIWIMVMIFYPLVSVYPQELIFRGFFFDRYRDLFPTRWGMILASGVTFGYVHIIFESWASVGLTVIGGILFAWTYDRTRSVLAASFEHALFGCFAFTVGLGALFYTGAVR